MSAQTDLVRKSFAAYDAGDFDALLELVHPDVEVHDWPEAVDPRVYRGVEGIFQAREEWSKAWEEMVAEPIQLTESGDRVFAELRNTGKGRGSSIEMETTTFGVYTFRDDRVAKIQFFMSRESALAAAGLTEEQLRQEAT